MKMKLGTNIISFSYFKIVQISFLKFCFLSSVYAGFSTCRVRHTFATHRPSALLQLTEFGSGVNERTINNLYVRAILGLYIFVSRSCSFIDSSVHELNM